MKGNYCPVCLKVWSIVIFFLFATSYLFAFEPNYIFFVSYLSALFIMLYIMIIFTYNPYYINKYSLTVHNLLCLLYNAQYFPCPY